MLKAGKIAAAVLPEPFASQAQLSMGVTPLADLDQGATSAFPVQGCAVTRQWAAVHPGTLAAFRAAFEQGQEIADTNRSAVEQAMEALPSPLGLTKVQAAIMALDSYPVGAVDVTRLQRVADVMHQFLRLPDVQRPPDDRRLTVPTGGPGRPAPDHRVTSSTRAG